MVFSTIRKIKEILTKLGYQKIKWHKVKESKNLQKTYYIISDWCREEED